MLRTEAILGRRSGARIGGFTLIELLAVLVILAAISAVVAPALTNLGATRQSAAASRLVRDLQLARQRSVARGLRTWVVFDAQAQRYALFIEQADPAGRAGRQPMIDDSTGKPFVVQYDRGEWRGVAIESVDVEGSAEIGFDSRGRPLVAGETVLEEDATISLSGGHVIRITARTGFVHRLQ